MFKVLVIAIVVSVFIDCQPLELAAGWGVHRELFLQGLPGQHALHDVRPVQAVHAVRAEHPQLLAHHMAVLLDKEITEKQANLLYVYFVLICLI